MSNMIISDDQSKEKEYLLQKWKKVQYDDHVDIELYTDNGVISYSINCDCRENNIEYIISFFTNVIENAINGKTTLYISEFLVRRYITVTSDEQIKQFTAIRQ